MAHEVINRRIESGIHEGGPGGGAKVASPAEETKPRRDMNEVLRRVVRRILTEERIQNARILTLR